MPGKAGDALSRSAGWMLDGRVLGWLLLLLLAPLCWVIAHLHGPPPVSPPQPAGTGTGTGTRTAIGSVAAASGAPRPSSAVFVDPHRRWRRGWGALCAALLGGAPLLVAAEALLARPSLVACSGCVGWSPVPTGQRLLVAAAALYPATVSLGGRTCRLGLREGACHLSDDEATGAGQRGPPLPPDSAAITLHRHDQRGASNVIAPPPHPLNLPNPSCSLFPPLR